MTLDNRINLKVGEKVYYQPVHYPDNQWENGIIKEIPKHTDTAVRVVFHCAGNWEEFQNYTGAMTNLRDLTLGWRHK